MMKKLFAVLLAAMMLLTMSFAVAENAKTAVVYDDNLTLNVVYPEGYEVETTSQGVYLLVNMTSEANADFVMLICPDEEYADLERLNDMEECDMEGYVLGLMEGYNDAEVTWLQTAYGTDVILLNENNATMDMAELITLYHGYVIDLMIVPEENEAVTGLDIEAAMKFLSDMDFVYTAQ